MLKIQLLLFFKSYAFKAEGMVIAKEEISDIKKKEEEGKKRVDFKKAF